MEISLGGVIELLANLGVVAGIIFLAMELKQNNQLLRAQARRDQLDARAIALAAETKDTDLANLSFKLASGETLTPFEKYRFEAWAFHLFIQWEWQYGEYRAGTLAADRVSVGGWQSRAAKWPQLEGVWRSLTGEGRSVFSRDFVQFVEQNVFHR